MLEDTDGPGSGAVSSVRRDGTPTAAPRNIQAKDEGWVRFDPVSAQCPHPSMS